MLFYQRLLIYFLIWFIYLTFMSKYSPLGIQWLDWHKTRIFNFSEFLNLNGFFSYYGFSIWSQCEDCVLNSTNWQDDIYLSLNLLSNLPYVLLNKYFVENFFKLYGHYIDKSVILLTGILLAEIYSKFNTKKLFSYKSYLASIMIFIFFIINPWTYKMILAYWVHIFFVFFFILGNYLFLVRKENLGLISFFISGCIDYQSSAGLIFYYISILILSSLKQNFFISDRFYPNNSKNNFIKYKVILSFLLPLLIYILLKSLALNTLDNYTGASIIERIGISGSDIHNGSIVGALQFLGGNRITQCLSNFNYNLNLMSFDDKIAIFNCSLSILSLVVISILSILGLFLFFKIQKKIFNTIILPLLFLLLSYTLILQQSSSVHLMGYSYFFSIIFSVGLTSIIFNILKKYNFSVTSVLLSVPIILGLIFVCLRVSMLTGING